LKGKIDLKKYFFILQNVEILRYNRLIEFFKIKKTLLVIYIKNLILVNENKYEMVDDNSSSSSNDLSNESSGIDKDIKDNKIRESIKNKIKNEDKKENKINKIKSINIINDKKDDNSNNNIEDIINNKISAMMKIQIIMNKK